MTTWESGNMDSTKTLPLHPADARRQREDHGMIAQCQRKRMDLAVGLDRRCADRRIIHLYRCECASQMDSDRAGALDLLPPHHQVERAVTFLQEQIMHGGRLIGDRVVE